MLPTLLLVIFLLCAVITDLVTRSISNKMVMLGLICGTVLSAIGWNGTIGIQESLFGVIGGLLFFLPLYTLGKMGGGDVKLLSMVGGFIGLESIVLTGVCTLFIGGFMAVFWLSLRKKYCYTSEHLVDLQTVSKSQINRPQTYTPSSVLRYVLSDHRFPYAPAIAAGTYMGSLMRFSFN